MGMFDEIIVKKQLPLPIELFDLNLDWQNYKFQTKDLENCLLEYIITEDNELVEVEVDREYIPYTEEELKKLKNKWSFFKDVVEKSRKNVKLDFHGKIKFYTYDKFDDKFDFSIDFESYFSYGKLDKIVLLEYKKYESKDNSEWWEKYKQEQKKPWNKIKNFLSKYFGWRWVWSKISKLIYKLSNFLTNLHFFIHKKII